MPSWKTLWIILLLPVVLAGCRSATLTPTVTPVQATPTVTGVPDTATPPPTPTVTPLPPALHVTCADGASLSASLAEYQAQMTQIQAANTTLGITQDGAAMRRQVLDDMIGQLLLAHGAYAAGFAMDDAAVQVEIDRQVERLGLENFQGWLTQQGYDEAAFRDAVRWAMASAWERDRLAAEVPAEAEQIHARQILTTDEAVANRALEQVKLPGVNFAAQAMLYDPVTGGDLGWFPRGYLTQPAVEEAAFALQPGEISGVIKSEIGYHILQIIAREPSRLLSPDAVRVLQHKYIENWLQAQRAECSIEELAP